mgnify:CR=1 FL=1
MKLNHTLEIDCPVEKVWYWLATPERAMAWQTNVSNTEILHQTPDWIGTTFRETVEENGRSTEMEGVVTKYIENQSLAMHMEGQYNTVDVEWYLEKLGEQSCLTVEADIRFKSFRRWMSIIFWPVFMWGALKQLQDEFTRLEELCECGNRTPPICNVV